LKSNFYSVFQGKKRAREAMQYQLFNAVTALRLAVLGRGKNKLRTLSKLEKITAE